MQILLILSQIKINPPKIKTASSFSSDFFFLTILQTNIDIFTLMISAFNQRDLHLHH